MYEHTILNKKIRISNKAYDALVRKWDVNNIQKMDSYHWGVYGKCEYCHKYVKKKCKYCPFKKFATSSIGHGCCYILDEMFPREFMYTISLNSALWDTKKAAIACVSAVEKELKKFEKVGK